MPKLNVGRVMVGGAAAGIVVFAVNGVVDGVLLNSAFQDWALGMGSLIHPPARPAAMGLWMSMSLIYGIVGVWMYAGMRPRYGAGLKTALCAGLLLWIGSKVTASLDLTALGILPAGLIVGLAIGSLIGTLLGVACGAWLYKE